MSDSDAAHSLGAFLRRHEITQRAASVALGVTNPTIHDWVTGAKRPTAAHREAIAIWTSGAVPADAWLTDEERSAVRAARPFAGGDS